MSGFEITAPVSARFNGIDCPIGTVTLRTNGEPTVAIQAEALEHARRVFSGIETAEGG